MQALCKERSQALHASSLQVKGPGLTCRPFARNGWSRPRKERTSGTGTVDCPPKAQDFQNEHPSANREIERIDGGSQSAFALIGAHGIPHVLVFSFCVAESQADFLSWRELKQTEPFLWKMRGCRISASKQHQKQPFLHILLAWIELEKRAAGLVTHPDQNPLLTGVLLSFITMRK